ncbi:MAG TPA: hypothetical protein VJ111_09775 [Chitinophagaceae bacterium]|nr:hypothetical protein [Chitinophagaceae bacterium]
MIRQLIEERQSTDKAKKIMIYHFKDSIEFADSIKGRLINPIVIDMNTVIKSPH